MGVGLGLVFFGSFRVRVRGGVRVRVRFWLGPGTRVSKKISLNN